MRRVVVFGAGGWVGSELCRLIPGAEGFSHEFCDVTKPDDVDKVLASGEGELHVINATGRNFNGLLKNYEDWQYEQMISDNLTGCFNIARAFVKVQPPGGSSLILMTSVVPRKGIRGASVYAAVKGAVPGMVRSLAREFAPDYRINAIELGYFEGGIINTISPMFIGAIIDMIPLGKLGDAESIAQTCSYLMDCKYATGGTVPLTGGL